MNQKIMGILAALKDEHKVDFDYYTPQLCCGWDKPQREHFLTWVYFNTDD